MRLFVLARSYQDFKRWCWEKGIPELHATYVANPERFKGQYLAPQQVVRVPGYEGHPQHAAIEEELSSRMVTA